MMNKLTFLTKMSLNKKIKTKWFLIANLIFLVLIVGVINIDMIIKFFGGDFLETQEILVIDEVNCFDNFSAYYNESMKYLDDYTDTEVIRYTDSYDEGVELARNESNKIILVISPDSENYIKAEVVSKSGLGTITSTLINASLNNVRSGLALLDYDISPEEYQNISKSVSVKNTVLTDKNMEDDFVASTVSQILLMPLFLLIMYLIQMIGAEVNEEKTTRSMEIIISNVSPRVHFLSKIISANLFVIIQGILLIVFAALGIGIRFMLTGGDIVGGLESEINTITAGVPLGQIMDTLGMILPIMLVMVLLTFIAYSLLAGILASMTTNLEDFQQLQTPIVIISLIGFYLGLASSMFTGSLFIRIMSYIPFISSMLAPTLYVMGEIGLVDLVIAVVLLIGVIYLLMKYGLRVYKVGILNYSQNGLWKRMFKALKEK